MKNKKLHVYVLLQCSDSRQRLDERILGVFLTKKAADTAKQRILYYYITGHPYLAIIKKPIIGEYKVHPLPTRDIILMSIRNGKQDTN